MPTLVLVNVCSIMRMLVVSNIRASVVVSRVVKENVKWSRMQTFSQMNVYLELLEVSL